MPTIIRKYWDNAVPWANIAAPCTRSVEIVWRTHASAGAMATAFGNVRQARGVNGTPTDDEQDLLRAMLVFALAGLDAAAKQLIRDALPHLAHDHENVRGALEEFSARKMRGLGQDSDANKLLVKLLLHENSETALIDEFVRDLVGDSLQSTEELRKIARILDIDDREFTQQIDGLRDAFTARNKIIHELDINWVGANRKREFRTRERMITLANQALATSDMMVRRVNTKIRG